MVHRGGCLCGGLRSESTADPIVGGYCHCRLCQKSTGAPVLTWVSFPLEAFRYSQDSPSRYASSSNGIRKFCGVCDTQIAFRQAAGGTTVEVNAGAMDESGNYPPQEHIWCDSAINWLNIDDGLPRYACGAPAPQRS